MSASRSPSPRSRTGRSIDRDTPREHHGGGGASRDDNVGTIFVGNLNRDTSERRLREYFDTYGRVLSAKVPLFRCCIDPGLPTLSKTFRTSNYRHCVTC